MLRALLLVAWALPAAAQFTSPTGRLNSEGVSYDDQSLFGVSDVRYQQIDSTSVGMAPFAIRRMAWRRDAVIGPRATWSSRSIWLTILLGEGVRPGTACTGFEANYRGTPTQVVAQRMVVLPDWSPAAPSTPAPFDLIVPLDAPWTYMATAPLLYEVSTFFGQNGRYGLDLDGEPGGVGTREVGFPLGAGCVATGQRISMLLMGTAHNHYTRLRAEYDVAFAPPYAPGVLVLGFAPATFRLPGLCSDVLLTPSISVPIGQASPLGAVTNFGLENIPSAGMVGRPLYAQAAYLDPGQPGLPVALSSGTRITFPAPNSQPPTALASVTALRFGYEFYTPRVFAAGFVTRFD